MANPKPKPSAQHGGSKTDSIIHHAIRNYQLTSRSKQFWRLKPQNEAKIARAIRKKGQQEELSILAQKQSYYTEKLHELLSRAAEERDPRLIQDQADAEWYIKKYVVSDPKKLKLVEFQVWKQRQFHREFERELNAVETPKFGLAKLQNVNMEAENRRKSAFQELYMKYAEQQVSLAKECEEQLEELSVPFFTGFGSQENKSFVLDLLYKCVEKETSETN